MSSNVVNQVAYLRTSREFPEEIHQLSVEVNKTYVDTANAVNARTIGIFPTVRPAITGESWFLNNQRQQTLRQVYPFGAIAAGASLSIHYQTEGVAQFSRIYGTCKTALPDSRPIPYASVAANSNIDLRVDTAAGNIVISIGASSPNILSGLIVLEWLSQV
jgi:hypothetical protein